MDEKTIGIIELIMKNNRKDLKKESFSKIVFFENGRFILFNECKKYFRVGIIITLSNEDSKNKVYRCIMYSFDENQRDTKKFIGKINFEKNELNGVWVEMANLDEEFQNVEKKFDAKDFINIMEVSNQNYHYNGFIKKIDYKELKIIIKLYVFEYCNNSYISKKQKELLRRLVKDTF